MKVKAFKKTLAMVCAATTMATLTPSVGLLTSTVSTFAETTGNTDTTLTLSGDSKMTGMVSASDITALTAESAVTNGNILTL